jgi:hypothetical protein
MKILFDLSSAQPVHGGDFHGGGEYAKTVFYRLVEKKPSDADDDADIEIFYNPNRNIDSLLLKQCEKHGICRNVCKNNAQLSALLLDKNYDVFYSALPYAYTDIQIPPGTKFIYPIHGLRALEYPYDSYLSKYEI